MSNLNKAALTEAFSKVVVNTVTVEFYGAGDSGELVTWNMPEEFTDLAQEALDEYVEFDWYNNEGGGGRITFHRDIDGKGPGLTITAYMNQLSEIPMMNLEATLPDTSEEEE